MEDEAEFAIMLSGIIDEEENLESEKSCTHAIMCGGYFVNTVKKTQTVASGMQPCNVLRRQ